jgi:hypothetical protein
MLKASEGETAITKTRPSPKPAISQTKNGALGVTEAGSQKITRAFQGSNPLSDPPLESNTTLENMLFGMAAATIRKARAGTTT